MYMNDVFSLIFFKKMRRMLKVFRTIVYISILVIS